MEEKKLIFIGAPDSGKTTYIACLWDYITSSKSDKKLDHDSFKNTEHEYLEKIKTEWIQCKEVPRTFMANKTENVSMKIVDVVSKKKFTLEIPDLSGELFESFYRDRFWSEDFDLMLSSVSGVLLFINPIDTNNRSEFISFANSMKTVLQGDDIKSAPAMTKEKGIRETEMKNPKQWNHKLSSNQVKLVDLLQFIEDRHSSNRLINLSIIVSRWDLVKETMKQLEPADWLKINLPLLDQYISANDKTYNYKVFGVSAQGCDYESELERQRTLILEPYNRPIVQDGKSFTSDISSPITWLTENEN